MGTRREVIEEFLQKIKDNPEKVYFKSRFSQRSQKDSILEDTDSYITLGTASLQGFTLYCSATQVASSWQLFKDGDPYGHRLGFIDGARVKKEFVKISCDRKGVYHNALSGMFYEITMVVFSLLSLGCVLSIFKII